MINIIQEGTLYPYKLKCFKCGCIFEFQDEDVFIDNLGHNEIMERINCPTCGQDINAWSRQDWLKKAWDSK